MDKTDVYRALKLLILFALLAVITLVICPRLLVKRITLNVLTNNDGTLVAQNRQIADAKTNVKRSNAEFELVETHDVDVYQEENVKVELDWSPHTGAVTKPKTLFQRVVRWKRDGNCVRRLPMSLIIGVQKCGTKALAEFLSIHPEIAIDSKQTYFFSANYSRGFNWYLNQLPCSRNEQITIERTPQYFYFDYVPARIHAANPDMKLLLIVKDPVTRTLSNFAMAQYRGREPSRKMVERRIFIENKTGVFVLPNSKYVAKSRYADYIQNWLQYFPRNQILVIDGAKFAHNPSAELAKVESFLGIKHFFRPSHFLYNHESGFHCLNGSNGKKRKTPASCLPKTKGRTHQNLSRHYLKVLRNYFSSENERFYKIVNHRYKW